MWVDLTGRRALVTGATRGIGLATALALAARGARCVLTCGWGGDEDAARAAFAAIGAPPPLIVQADVSREDDTEELMRQIVAGPGAIDVFVSNVAFGRPAPALADLERRDLERAVGYSAWPLVDYTRRLGAATGDFPRHVIAVSSFGGERITPGYDLIGAAKASLEVLARYLAHRLAPHGVRVNVVRGRWVATRAFDATFGPDCAPFLAARGQLQPAEDIADAIVALASGLMDGMIGQILAVDGGATFRDNLMHLYSEARARGGEG
ncbi:MAG: SDR family oxidoreductase [bacterium]